eukprot:TRINITY_DN293_c0_g1_i2.p3 TRINITY_DN293_c0_g1~~TRINITY_DN293_c0_g1_i2.p3  ORF type:complete len:141 (+),score=61.18 TRINITY_DN293_c0_g1_i2:107-529(+)
MVDKQGPITLRDPVFINVEQIKPSSTGYNVYVKVEKITEEFEVKRPEGAFKVRDAVCGDATGIVNVRLKDKNAEFLAPGKIIAIRNGRVEVIRGNIRLEVDRWGKVTEETVSIPSVNNEKNISSIEYERVVRRQRNLKHK